MKLLKKLLCEIGIHRETLVGPSYDESWAWMKGDRKFVSLRRVRQEVCCNCKRKRLHITKI